VAKAYRLLRAIMSTAADDGLIRRNPCRIRGASLRWGELAALRRSDIDLTARTIRVERQFTEASGNGLTFGPPRSAAGRRTVPMPGIVLADVTTHLASYVPYSDDALIFTSPEETLFRHCNFRRRAWLPALATAELAGVHFHDLHHAGNTYTARPSSPEPETPPVASCYGIEHRSSDPQIGAGCSASRPESACAGQGQLKG
jgi:integrase